MRFIRILAVLIAFLSLFFMEPAPAPAQALGVGQVPAVNAAEIKAKAPKVYIDFERGDMDYIRTEIPFVNYVRDRKEADVHVLITTQATGSGGTEYTLAFIGQGAYAGVDNSLDLRLQQDRDRGGDPPRLRRRPEDGARSPIRRPDPHPRPARRSSSRRSVSPTDVVDPWKFWVFSLSVGGELDNESQTKSQTLTSSSAVGHKITPDLKIRLGVYGQFTGREVSSTTDETIKSHSESLDFAGLLVKSLGEHWSAGLISGASSSTFNNLRSKFIPAAAVEYDLFPYSESTRRQLRFLYKVGPELTRYREETIYDKTGETLLAQSLSATLEISEPWGSLSSSLEGSHYFHDLARNRIVFMTELSFRIFKGLDFNIDGIYERIRDQLSLAKGGATLEEILLRRRELATSYNLRFQVSLSYTFGSIFSNVVNPRFGGLGILGHYWY